MVLYGHSVLPLLTVLRFGFPQTLDSQPSSGDVLVPRRTSISTLWLTIVIVA